MVSRMLSVMAVVVAAAVLVTDAQAKPDAGCRKAKAAQAGGCGSCRVTLKATAFGDANPAAGDVGTTTGQSTALQATLNRGCELPKGARIVILREELNANGDTVSYPVRLRCSGRSCRISQTRRTDGGYRYQAVIVGCKGGKRSKIVTVMWTGGGSTGSGGGTGGGGTSGGGSGQATVAMTLKQVFFDPQPGDPYCTIPLPGGAGAASAVYRDPNGNYTINYKWSMPQVIAAGATASLEVGIVKQSPGTLNLTAGIGIRPPREVGITPADLDVYQVIGVDRNEQPQSRVYTFNPTRPFVAGEKFSIRVRAGCTDVVYEYEGI